MARLRASVWSAFRGSPLCLLLLLISGGCSAPPRPAAPPSGLAAANPRLSPAENLAELASREVAGKPASSIVKEIPAPPGVEAAALEPRSPADPHAFLSLEAVLREFAARRADAHLLPIPDSPDDPDTRAAALRHYVKARSAALDGRTLQAILELQKAQQLDPGSAEILRELARCYFAENRISQALEIYDRLLQLDPDHAKALFAVGLASAGRRDFERSLTMLARLLASDEEIENPASEILAQHTLATSLRELGYDRAAIEASLPLLDLPDHLLASEHGPRLATVYRQRSETWRFIGDAHCRLGEYEQALAAYAAAAELPTGDAAALHARLIYANLRLGRTFSAQQAALQAAADGPVSDREVRLFSYLFEHAAPIDLLAAAMTDLYRANPDDSSMLRAAVALQPQDQARGLLREFVARRPRDLDGVHQMLEWAAQTNLAVAADLAASLANENADLADAYAERLLLVSKGPAAIAALKSLPESPGRAQMETKLIWKAGGMGEAWHVCAVARQKWPEHAGLALQQIQIAAGLQESALLEEAIRTSPPLENSAGLIGLSQAQRAMGQMEEAIALAKQAVEREPDNVEALIELARAHLGHAASLASDPSVRAAMRKSIDQAVAHAEQAIALNPQRDEAHEILMLIYSPTGIMADTNLFRQALHQLREIHPQSALFSRLAAQEAIGQRRFEQAIERLTALYENNPLDTASLTLAVTAWQQWGRLEAAEQWLDERLKRRPGDTALFEQWIRVQLLRQRADAVIADLERRIASNPDDFLARRLLETVYRASGQTDAAMQLGEQRLLARPEGVRRNVELAALYAGAERAEPAVQYLVRVLDHAEQASLDELAGAIRVLGRLDRPSVRDDVSAGGNPGGNIDALCFEIVERTVERFPEAPLQVFGYGLRALSRMKMVDERFDELAQQAVAQGKGGGGATIQEADQWREIAQALINDGNPAAAARALRARLEANQRLDADAAGLLMRAAIVCDALADVQDAQADHAEQTVALLRALQQRGMLAGIARSPVSPDEARDPLVTAFFDASIFYTIIGSRDGANRLLRETLAIDPAHGMAMNNLGYARIEAGHDDPETVQLIHGAHALLPDDSSVLDTVGWLRYKQGIFADVVEGRQPIQGAVTLLQRSKEKSEEPNAEIADHLGDAHWRLGNAEAALQHWREAVKILENDEHRKRVVQFNHAVQVQAWRLLVLDPQQMYDREYGPILERARRKIEAATKGEAPPVEPTFAEQGMLE